MNTNDTTIITNSGTLTYCLKKHMIHSHLVQSAVHAPAYGSDL